MVSFSCLLMGLKFGRLSMEIKWMKGRRWKECERIWGCFPKRENYTWSCKSFTEREAEISSGEEGDGTHHIAQPATDHPLGHKGGLLTNADGQFKLLISRILFSGSVLISGYPVKARSDPPEGSRHKAECCAAERNHFPTECWKLKFQWKLFHCEFKRRTENRFLLAFNF